MFSINKWSIIKYSIRKLKHRPAICNKSYCDTSLAKQQIFDWNYDELNDKNSSDLVKSCKNRFETLNKIKELNKYEEEEVLMEEAEAEEDEFDLDKNLVLKPMSCKESKEDYIWRSLAAFVDVYVVMGKPVEALQTLEFYRMKKKSFAHVSNIDIFNNLMNGFAAKKNWHKVKYVFNLIGVAKLEPTIQSFVPVFECFGRFLNSDREITPKSDISTFLKLFREKHGFTFNLLMNDGIFMRDQREWVSNFIKEHDPKFEPIYSLPVLSYNSSLTNSLNDISQYEFERVLSLKDPLSFFDPDQIRKSYQKQLQYEVQGFLEVKSVEKSSKDNNEERDNCREILKSMMKEWEEKLRAAFSREVSSLKAQNQMLHENFISPMDLKPYLLCLDDKQYVQVMLIEVEKLAETCEFYSSSLNSLYRNIGNAIYSRYQVSRKRKFGVIEKLTKIYNDYSDLYASKNEISAINARQKFQILDHLNRNSGPNILVKHDVWPSDVVWNIGQFLYKIILSDLHINVNCFRKDVKTKNYQPAFYPIFRRQGIKLRQEIKSHRILSKLWRESEQKTFKFPINLLPMCCPPLPWTNVSNGGYLIAHSDVVRLPRHALQQWTRLTNVPNCTLYPSLDSLNSLSAVPWRVNKPILNIILNIFNSGGSEELNVPKPASSLLPTPNCNSSDSNKSSDKFHVFQWKRKKAEMHSIWCDTLYRLSLANHFKNEIFWMPHNLDFRGRVYPVPPHLCHLGSDLSRSMLIFAIKKPLGPNGLRWLKLHLANLLGTKKRNSLEERIAYIETKLDDIQDSADNPLKGRKWWMKAEEPWQALSCCIEITKALREPSGAEKFLSGFPIHQDGSCNGLQHYAALGRDSSGAFSVNLMPSHEPQDVYSEIAKLVDTARVNDANNNNSTAKALEGVVKRKIVKQTVMTTVYGVTKYGARSQIAKQLKDLDDFPKEKLWESSTYLATKTFESLRSMFHSAKNIQDWFTECARIISSHCYRNVEWVTPLGLPVVQPYIMITKPKKHAKNITVVQEKPNVVKQKNAFPPNFIHSLDSCHMMLTSLFCEREKVSFVSVHDCFWTHPIDAEKMNRICREQFVALHSRPILENLSEFFIQNYAKDLKQPNHAEVFKKIPEKGDFNINKVLRSVYFFS